jgi:hypothetical protein
MSKVMGVLGVAIDQEGIMTQEGRSSKIRMNSINCIKQAKQIDHLIKDIIRHL